MKNSILIRSWRKENPVTRLTVPLLQDLLGEESLTETDFSYADLSGADLSDADFSGSNFKRANLSFADAQGSSFDRSTLSEAKLDGGLFRGASFNYARLTDTDAFKTDFAHSTFAYADLSNADFVSANLTGADFRHANTSSTYWNGLAINGMKSGQFILLPTPAGPYVRVGCWEGSLDDLEELVEGRAGAWPGARNEERERRKPVLRAAIAAARAHLEYRKHLIQRMERMWV